MTPEDIITKAIQEIPGIRMPVVRWCVKLIFKRLSDEGYSIVDGSLDKHALD